jgi:glycine cleavage system H protein
MDIVPENLKYTPTHEWVRLESDGSVTVGITDHAQQLLGDMVYVELPQIDRDIQQGAEIGVVESVKAASDIYSPLSGKVLAINQELNTLPELINQDPYDKGWIFRLAPSDSSEIDALLNSENYQKQIS